MIKGDSEDPIGDYIAINQELELYNPYLLNKTQVIVINKIDMPDVKKKLPSLTKKLKKLAGHTRIMGISALTRENCRELMCRINNVLQTIPPQDYMELFTDEEERINFEDDDLITNRNSLVKKQTFQIIPDPDHRPNHWHILGKRIERIVAMTNWDYYESMLRFQRIMDVEGISKGLETAGVKQGDTVEVGSYCFTYWSKRNQWIAELGIEDSIPRLVKRAEREEEEEQLKKLKRKKDNKELKPVSETNVEDDED